MGVKGLMSLILERRSECSQTVNLIEIARERGGIELIVDFYSFEHMLIKDNLWKSLASFNLNDSLCILGAEYATIDAYISKVITDLKSLGISFVFVLDGSKGSSPEDTKHKFDTWKHRHRNEVQRKREVLEVCAGQKLMTELHENSVIRPVLLEIQVVQTLRDVGCEVLQLPEGEADLFIAKQLAGREKGYAILSNDSDFCIFKNCSFIPSSLFDISGDLGLGKALVLPQKPAQLICGVVTSQSIQHFFKFPSEEMLVEMSIVAGNDFTVHYMPRGFASLLRVANIRSIASYADWVRQHGRVENNHIFQQEMMRNQQLASAVEHSRKFYSLEHDSDEEGRGGYIFNLIVNRVRSGQYPANFVSMYRCFYWYRYILDDGNLCAPAEEMLAPLRAALYAILLPRHKPWVKEYGQTMQQDFQLVQNYATGDPNLPSLNHIRENQIFKNLRLFHYIMTRLEPGPVPEKTWFDKYGRKTGFIFYVLRYFLLLNRAQYLHVTEAEFLALVATAFGASKESAWQELRVCPDPRCITIAAVFQDIYRHAFVFLGSILHLKHEFPLPKEIFSGSMWTVLYALSGTPDSTRMFPRSSYDQLAFIKPEKLHWAESERDFVIHEKRHLIEHLTEGVFNFNSRHF